MNDEFYSAFPREPEEPELAAETESPEPEETDEIQDALAEIREELAGASAENRRNTRRVFDALKQFGAVLDALSATVNSLHESTRPTIPASPPASGSPIGTIELADRIDRIALAIKRIPAPPRPWWPPARRAHEAWSADSRRLAESFVMLTTHARSLLASSGLEHIACEGEIFDPTCMTAVESVSAPHVPDHTVVAEILPGWRESGGGRIIRPAQVRVARTTSTSEKSS
jgi:molecular chaperone GrpE (heat shock protein)